MLAINQNLIIPTTPEEIEEAKREAADCRQDATDAHLDALKVYDTTIPADLAAAEKVLQFRAVLATAQSQIVSLAEAYRAVYGTN